MLRVQPPQRHKKVQTYFPKATTPAPLSEAEALAQSCGTRVIRLSGLRDLIQELPRLERVKAVIGNRHAVHEREGGLQKVKLLGSQGWIQGKAMSLRLRFNHWHYGFAVREEYDDGYRNSFQFFDRDGSAVYKVYLTAGSQEKVFQQLVACYRSADQRPRQSVAPVPRLPERADEAVDVAGLRQAWLGLRDIRDLPALFRSVGVSRLQGLRLAGADLARPLALPDLEVFMEVAHDAALPLTFCVSNDGGEQTYTGFVSSVSVTGTWYTILDTHFALRMQREGVNSAWVVRHPTPAGVVAALDLYDDSGRNILQLQSPYLPGCAEHEIWWRLLTALEAVPPSAHRLTTI